MKKIVVLLVLGLWYVVSQASILPYESIILKPIACVTAIETPPDSVVKIINYTKNDNNILTIASTKTIFKYTDSIEIVKASNSSVHSYKTVYRKNSEGKIDSSYKLIKDSIGSKWEAYNVETTNSAHFGENGIEFFRYFWKQGATRNAEKRSNSFSYEQNGRLSKLGSYYYSSSHARGYYYNLTYNSFINKDNILIIAGEGISESASIKNGGKKYLFIDTIVNHYKDNRIVKASFFRITNDTLKTTIQYLYTWEKNQCVRERTLKKNSDDTAQIAREVISEYSDNGNILTRIELVENNTSSHRQYHYNADGSLSSIDMLYNGEVDSRIEYIYDNITNTLEEHIGKSKYSAAKANVTIRYGARHICLSLMQSTETTVFLYTLNGRKIFNLLQKQSLEKGDHIFTIKPGSVATGVYLANVEVNGFNIHKTISILN